MLTQAFQSYSNPSLNIWEKKNKSSIGGCQIYSILLMFVLRVEYVFKEVLVQLCKRIFICSISVMC